MDNSRFIQAFDILESISDGFFALDRDWRFVYVNQRAASNLACKPEDLIGQNIWNKFPAIQGTPHETNYRQAMQDGQPRTFEMQGVLADKWYDIRVYPSKEGISVYWLDITERKRAEAAVREGENRFRLIVENSVDGINLLDLATMRYIFMSPSQVALTGFTVEEMNNFSAEEAYERVHPEDREISISQQQQLISGKTETLVTEYRWKVKSGEYRWFSDSRRLVYDSKGRPIALVGISRDISERKRAEAKSRELLEDLSIHREELQAQRDDLLLAQQAARESTDKYLDLYHNAPVGYMTLSVSGRILEANNTASRLLRMSDGGLADVFLSKFVSQAQLGKFYQYWHKTNTTGSGSKLNIRLRRPDGTEFCAQLDSLVVRNPKLSSPQVRTTIEDITESQHLEDLLHQRAEELESIMDLAPAAIWVSHDPECRQITGNRMANEIYEAAEGENVSACPTPGELVQHRRFFRGDRELKAEELPMQEAASTNQPVKGSELKVVLPSGNIRFIWGSAIPLRDSEGRARGAMAVFQDITQRKQSEEALSQYTRELEAANKELESFSYSVSHDLRQPLRALEGFSELLLTDYRDKLDVTGQDYLERIRKASQYMSELTDDLLKLSRVSRADLFKDSIHLSEMVQSIVREMQEISPNREVEFTLAPGLICTGDKPLLTIALRNLLENAWKFTSKISQAKIEFGSRDIQGEMVFYVKDNGIGFDMQYAGHLFEPFQRLHSSQDYKGTGIGLAIVQRVIRRHGGRIWAEAAPNAGATFYFTLE